MAVPRRPAPVKEVDLEQTAELPVIDFTGSHADLSSSDATLSVAALSLDDTLARTDTYAVPSLTGAGSLSENLRDVEERLHRKAERVSSLERELESFRTESESRAAALRTDAESRERSLRAESAAQVAALRSDHETALREAQEAAAEAGRKLAQLNVRFEDTQSRLGKLETRAGQQVATLSSQEKELAQRTKRFEELQQEFTTASSLARELGRARDGLADRVHTLEQSLAERTTALDQRIAEVATTQARLAIRENEHSRLVMERDELRGCTDRQLEALHRLEGYRGVAEALIDDRDAQIDARDSEISRLVTELKQLAERDERIASLEVQLTDTRAKLASQEQRVSSLSTDGRALEGRLGELNEALASADRSALAQSAALRVAADHAAEVESQLAAERERASKLGAELESSRRAATADLERARTTASSELESLRTSSAAELSAVRAAAKTELDTARIAAAAEFEAARAAAMAELEKARSEAAVERERLQAEATLERTTALSSKESFTAQLAERDADIARRKEELSKAVADIAERERAIVEREQAVTELLDDQQDQLARQTAELTGARDSVTRMEGDLRAAEQQLRQYESEQRHRESRLEELGRSAETLQTRLDEAQRRLTERDEQVRRLETEAHASASVLGKLQQSIQRLSREDTGARPAVTEAPLDTMARVLVRVDGGTEQIFSIGRRTTLGRTPDNDIRLDANFVSRHHAVVLASTKNTIIEDLNSTNGVVVNGRRITRQALQDGDVVNIGTTEFRFQLRPLGHAGDPS